MRISYDVTGTNVLHSTGCMRAPPGREVEYARNVHLALYSTTYHITATHWLHVPWSTSRGAHAASEVGSALVARPAAPQLAGAADCGAAAPASGAGAALGVAAALAARIRRPLMRIRVHVRAVHASTHELHGSRELLSRVLAKQCLLVNVETEEMSVSCA